jgi:hypothetical protein
LPVSVQSTAQERNVSHEHIEQQEPFRDVLNGARGAIAEIETSFTEQGFILRRVVVVAGIEFGVSC